MQDINNEKGGRLRFGFGIEKVKRSKLDELQNA